MNSKGFEEICMSAEKEELLDLAVRFATIAHEGVNRPFGGGPYIDHPYMVKSILEELGFGPELLAAAILHDVPEDVSLEKIAGIAQGLGFPIIATTSGNFRADRAAALMVMAYVFGSDVARLLEGVTKVTNREAGTREQRQAIEINHLEGTDDDCQTLKLADISANMRDVSKAPLSFTRRWVRERIAVLAVLTRGDARLQHVVSAQIEGYLSNQREADVPVAGNPTHL
jgi:(p)ppGpp synthase/HD superfamily hydrolase